MPQFTIFIVAFVGSVVEPMISPKEKAADRSGKVPSRVTTIEDTLPPASSTIESQLALVLDECM